MRSCEMRNCYEEKIIMLVAGGTGGHVFPSLSLINQMTNYNFIIITDQRGKEYYEIFFEKRKFDFKIFIHKTTSPSNKNLTCKIISIAIAGKMKKPGTPKPSIQFIDPSKLKILLKAEIKNKAEIKILPIKSKIFAI